MSNEFYPKISIIIPVFNGSKFMKEAIESAIKQTYNNIEVIVVNDGSTDNGATDRIAKSYGNKIRYYTKENGGVATALNLGIEKMNGDYFSWLSHDDVYKKDKIKKQVELLSELPKDTIIYSGYELIDEKSAVYACVDHRNRYTQEKLNTSLFPVLRGLANGCTMLIPKKYFDMVGKFDPSLPTTQDYELWFKIFRVANVRYSTDINVQMRQHLEQGSKNIDGHIEECNKLWVSFLDRISLCEMCKLDETPELFYERTLEFLKETPYKKATKHCEILSRKSISYEGISCKESKEIVALLINNYNRLYIEVKKDIRTYYESPRNLSLINRIKNKILKFF